MIAATAIFSQTAKVGLAISPSLTQTEFRDSEKGGGATIESYGTPPWIHYHLDSGEVEGHNLLASLCFYGELLLSVSITANLYPTAARDWSSYSLDVEAATKLFHERLLARSLSAPSTTLRLPFDNLPPSQTTLAHPRFWRFHWGKISSSHDPKGGVTAITIMYGDRMETASKDHVRRANERE